MSDQPDAISARLPLSHGACYPGFDVVNDKASLPPALAERRSCLAHGKEETSTLKLAIATSFYSAVFRSGISARIKIDVMARAARCTTKLGDTCKDDQDEN
ncbi:hypothetical protein ACVWZM_003014 [Bradyrhizobium sp. USDA 4501]